MKMHNRPNIDINKLLQPVIDAVTNESFSLGKDSVTGKLIPNQVTLDAITQFRKTFEQTGALDTLALLSDVYQKYAELTQAWNYDKRCALFEDGVVSFILRYVSIDDAMKFSQGLEYLQGRGETCNQSTITRDGLDFYESLRNSSSDFLYIEGSCVDISWGLAAKDRDRVAGALVCGHLKTLIESKSSQRNEIAEEKISKHNNSINSVNSSGNALASDSKSTNHSNSSDDELDDELLKYIPVTMRGFGSQPISMKADQFIDYMVLLFQASKDDPAPASDVKVKPTHQHRFFSKATGMQVAREDLTDAAMAEFYQKISAR